MGTSRQNLSGWSAGRVPRHVKHSSFCSRTAESRYSIDAPIPATDPDLKHMADEVTRELARRMHYAAFRAKIAKNAKDGEAWLARYFALRDQIILGNRKLVFRAVRQRVGYSSCTEDLASECQIVLMKAVALYNPWLGIRFSTYAFTCMLRALGRMCQRLASDRLSRSVSLDAIGESEPRSARMPSDTLGDGQQLSAFLRPEHPLLTSREKSILALRFCSENSRRSRTLESVGKNLGLSKERVRQVQAGALRKLRMALTGTEC